MSILAKEACDKCEYPVCIIYRILPCSLTSTHRLVKGGEEEKSKIVLAAIENKLPYLHRLVTLPN